MAFNLLLNTSDHRVFCQEKTPYVCRVKILEQLAQRLRELRIQQGLTQEQFSAMAGISYKFYQQIESGRKKQIWLSTVEKLADAYGLEVWEILTPETPSQLKLKDEIKKKKSDSRS